MSPKFSALDLLDLPLLERELLLRVARAGPATAETLASGSDCDPADVLSTIEKLVRDRRLQPLGDGRLEAVFGQISARTTIPAILWPAIATDRPYTRQEIATLRTAIPILHFARARMSQFADHGPGHAMRVRAHAVQLAYLTGLSAPERHLLRVAALFHDVGNVVERKRHHIISQETVEKLAADGELPFSPDEARLIGLLCRWHRRDYDPERVDLINGETIRTGLLASVLRVADAMDIDLRRSDYDERYQKVLRLFFPDALPFWTSLEEIAGVRIRSSTSVRLQVLTRRPAMDNMQIEMLRREVDATPLDWSIEQVALAPGDAAPQQDDPRAPVTGTRGRALLVIPFDAHSLVMAAISRKHLAAAGDAVELLCYPDTPDGTRWLWTEGLAGENPASFTRLVVIGDRPDSAATPRLFEMAERWTGSGVAVSVLNRYEANWSRLPRLIALGVDVTVGGDWAYFWGDCPSVADLEWARIAALCVRDPTLAMGTVPENDSAVAKGVQKAVCDVVGASSSDATERWRSAAESVLRRIETGDGTSFAEQGERFAESYLSEMPAGRVDGRVVVFDHPLPGPAQASPWILEAAIERLGRMPSRGLCFNVPHAIATWPDGDAVEILAITHWREEDALPIRLIYPDDIGPAPQGNEHALHVRVPADIAPLLLRALIDACNRR